MIRKIGMPAYLFNTMASILLLRGFLKDSLELTHCKKTPSIYLYLCSANRVSISLLYSFSRSVISSLAVCLISALAISCSMSGSPSRSLRASQREAPEAFSLESFFSRISRARFTLSEKWAVWEILWDAPRATLTLFISSSKPLF